MSDIELETAALERMRLENELHQLRFENAWLRQANKELSEALAKVRIPTVAMPNNAGEGEV